MPLRKSKATSTTTSSRNNPKEPSPAPSHESEESTSSHTLESLDPAIHLALLTGALEHAREFAHRFRHPGLAKSSEASFSAGAEDDAKDGAIHHGLHIRFHYARTHMWVGSGQQLTLMQLAIQYRVQFAACNIVVVLGLGRLSEGAEQPRPDKNVNNADCIAVQSSFAMDCVHSVAGQKQRTREINNPKGSNKGESADEGAEVHAVAQDPTFTRKEYRWLRDHGILCQKYDIEDEFSATMLLIDFSGENKWEMRKHIQRYLPPVLVLPYKLKKQAVVASYQLVHTFQVSGSDAKGTPKAENTVQAALQTLPTIMKKSLTSQTTVESSNFYNQIGKQYEEAFGHDVGLNSIVQRFLQHVPASARVLDCGCGTGKSVAKAIADSGRHVHGIDFASTMVGLSRAQIPDGTFEVTNMLKYVPSSRFDAIVVMLSLFELSRPKIEHMASKFAEWLKLGGTLLLGAFGAEDTRATGDMWHGDHKCAQGIPFTFMNHEVYMTLFTKKAWKELLTVSLGAFKSAIPLACS
ncbi:MAG: hypothetical protein Q9162_007498 [Coniocarpon cinnabarinum]